jgi:hypothetical protein
MKSIKKLFGWVLLFLGCMWTGLALALALFAGVSHGWLYALQFVIVASFVFVSTLVIYGGWHLLKGQSPRRNQKLLKLIVVFIALEMLIVALALGFDDTTHDIRMPAFKPFANTDVFEFLQPDVYTKELQYVKASGSPVCLVKYKNATDPSWDELLTFLQQDDTDEHLFRDGEFVCADFAELLHNNAEASGIRAAFVGVDFRADEEAHALNAFNTTDKGLVYVDCTSGSSSSSVIAELPDSEEGKGKACAHDKIAYVVEGNEYGIISVDQATSLNYEFYEAHKQNWREFKNDRGVYNTAVVMYNTEITAYEKAVAAYETAVDGRMSIRDPEEYEQLKRMFNDLKTQENALELRENELSTWSVQLDERQVELGWCHWESLGVVTSVEMRW